MRKLLTLLFVAFVSLAQAQDGFQHIVVKVKGIEDQTGKILVALYDSKENFLENKVGGTSTVFVGDSVTLTFENIKEGTYAISLFHDKNDNGKLDTNFMGIPTEPYAFSNNAKGIFGPPQYEDCKFEVIGSKKEIIIAL